MNKRNLLPWLFAIFLMITIPIVFISPYWLLTQVSNSRTGQVVLGLCIFPFVGFMTLWYINKVTDIYNNLRAKLLNIPRKKFY